MGDRPRSWEQHWDESTDEFVMFRAEAADSVDRLLAQGLVSAEDRVLDFGCGFGFLADLLAPHVAGLWLWDRSRNMTDRAGRRTARHPNVDRARLEDPRAHRGEFSVVLVNSVIQYMTAGELETWLARWGELLTPDGRIVISDVPGAQSGILREIRESLWFAQRQRFLIRSLVEAAKELRRNVSVRRVVPLYMPDTVTLQSMAERHQLLAEELPANLTYRRARKSYVVRHATQPSNDGAPGATASLRGVSMPATERPTTS